MQHLYRNFFFIRLIEKKNPLQVFFYELYESYLFPRPIGHHETNTKMNVTRNSKYDERLNFM